ncbi:hypothetical protein V8G54_009456 [Vigna mungo]|uniref:Aldehyde dehydrogenase domain-containing protein n=1 Tax=Vigna mungo TaxID=3915 RepID=A0AAQ3S5H5_VIGMU
MDSDPKSSTSPASNSNSSKLPPSKEQHHRGLLNHCEIMCAATSSSRVLVQEGIYDEFEKKLVEKAKAWVVGDPFDPKFQQGPQVDVKQFEKIFSYIKIGLEEV